MHFFSGKTGVCQNRGWHQLLIFSCLSKSFFQHQIFPTFLCHEFASLFYFLFIPGEAGVVAVFHSIASTQEPLDAEYHFCNFILIGICAETLHAISCKDSVPFSPQTIQPYSQDRFLFPFHYRKENQLSANQSFFLFFYLTRGILKETRKTNIDNTACPCLWVFGNSKINFCTTPKKEISNAPIIWLQIRVWGL